MKTPTVAVAAVALMVGAVAFGGEPLREWTSDTGSKIQASLASVTYTLKKQDGTTISVPASRLDFGSRTTARAVIKEPIGKTLDEILSVAKDAYQVRRLASGAMISLSGKAFVLPATGIDRQVTGVTIAAPMESAKDAGVAALIVVNGIRPSSDEGNRELAGRISSAVAFIKTQPSCSVMIPIDDFCMKVDCIQNVSVDETIATLSVFVQDFASGNLATYRLKLLASKLGAGQGGDGSGDVLAVTICRPD